MPLTDDPSDPRIVRGSADTAPVPQHDTYLVLSEAERAKGFVRPVRSRYRHAGAPQQQDSMDGTTSGTAGCGAVTTMGLALAETYAREPSFYGSTYCTGCNMHRPVGEVGEFVWVLPDGTDGERVGT